MMITTTALLTAVHLLAASPQVNGALPSTKPAGDNARFGLRVAAGGRYDDVRMCVATPAGVKGGMAMDVSVFIELPFSGDRVLMINIPVMRPILFAVAFGMLQFEPEVALELRWATGWGMDLIYGPSFGMVFHYGPDFNSEQSGTGRGSDFFAWGPRLGGYVALDLSNRVGLDFRLGLAPYVAPLFSAGDPENHNGWVVGIALDAGVVLLGG